MSATDRKRRPSETGLTLFVSATAPALSVKEKHLLNEVQVLADYIHSGSSKESVA